MKDIYHDGTYLQNNPGWHEEDSDWKAKHIASIITRNKLSPKTICEVGCGAGEVLNRLSALLDDDVNFVGYEISPHAFDVCKDKSKHNLGFYNKDILSEDGSPVFDIVMAIDVFEHIEDYFGFLRKLRSKGKYKIFHIPLDLSVQTVLRKYPLIRNRRSVGHLHYFTKETALATLEDTGYKILDYFYTNSAIDLSNMGWKAGLLRIPRIILSKINEDLAPRLLGGFSLMVLSE